METLRTIKTRIKTIESLIKATNAMKMVATVKLAKLKSCQKDYNYVAKKTYEFVRRAIYEIDDAQDAWFLREEGRTLILILSTDQGFCGSFNQIIMDRSKKIIIENPGSFVEVWGKNCASLVTNVFSAAFDQNNKKSIDFTDKAGWVDLYKTDNAYKKNSEKVAAEWCSVYIAGKNGNILETKFISDNAEILAPLYINRISIKIDKKLKDDQKQQELFEICVDNKPGNFTTTLMTAMRWHESQYLTAEQKATGDVLFSVPAGVCGEKKIVLKAKLFLVDGVRQDPKYPETFAVRGCYENGKKFETIATKWRAMMPLTKKQKAAGDVLFIMPSYNDKEELILKMCLSEPDKVNRLDVEQVSSEMADLIMKYILEQEVAKVIVVAGSFKNVLMQVAKAITIFPVEKQDYADEYSIIEGDKQDCIESLYKKYLYTTLCVIIKKHMISELFARTVTMDQSVKNAKDMFDKMKIKYNRTRQFNITTEMIEIVSGMEGLK